jgi:hypothetical protein
MEGWRNTGKFIVQPSACGRRQILLSLLYCMWNLSLYFCTAPRDLRLGSAAARLLGLWVRIPPREWMPLACERCVLSRRDICVGRITPTEESYRVWCVWVCLPFIMRRPLPIRGCCARAKNFCIVLHVRVRSVLHYFMHKTCTNCCLHCTTCKHHMRIIRCALLHKNFSVHYSVFYASCCYTKCSVCPVYVVTAIELLCSVHSAVQVSALLNVHTWMHIVFVHCNLYHTGIRGCAVGWGTASQNRRSQVRFPKVSL